MNAYQLKRNSIEAWSYLLRRDPRQATVSLVDVTPKAVTDKVTRYLLMPADSSEPISLIAKETNRSEASFYHRFATYLYPLVPRSWFTHCVGEQGWIVLDDITDYHAPRTWNREDLNGMVRDLATLHSTFWNWEPTQSNDLPLYLGEKQWSPQRVFRQLSHQLREHGYMDSTSDVPLYPSVQVGVQTAAFEQAAVGLELIRALGGWPSVLQEAHLEAVEDLLRRPAQMLRPLLKLPLTLLQGSPDITNWRVGVFDERTLLDWKKSAIGPGICDLIYFTESYYIFSVTHLQAEAAIAFEEAWPLLEETLIDSYFIQLSRDLQARDPAYRYSSRHVRRWALPAAHCLHTLTYWFPRFACWLSQMPAEHQSWAYLSDPNAEHSAHTAEAALAMLRPFIPSIFERFLNSYKLLTSDA